MVIWLDNGAFSLKHGGNSLNSRVAEIGSQPYCRINIKDVLIVLLFLMSISFILHRTLQEVRKKF